MPAPHLPSPDLGLAWRPIGLTDIDIWHDLMLAIEARDEPSERQDHDDLVEMLTDNSFRDPMRDSLIGIDNDGAARAFGHVMPLHGPTLRRVYLFAGVHPEWRGRGIGREVLRWQTERADEALKEADSPDLPWRIVVMHEEKLADRSALCAAAGYSAIRWSHEMSRTLGDGGPAIPGVEPPDGLEIAPWTEDLDEAVRLAHNEAFARHWGSQPRDEETWQTWTVGHRTYRRDWSRVVIDSAQPDSDGRPAIAGYLAAHAYTQDWEAKGYSQGWVDLIGVRPQWRGRGLAPALLAASMRAFADSGMEAAGLVVDTGNASGALALYTGMGFGVEHTSVSWALESPDATGI